MEATSMFIKDLTKLLDIAFNIAVIAQAIGWLLIRYTRLAQAVTGWLRFGLNLSAVSVFLAGLSEHPGDPLRWFVVLGCLAMMLCDDYGIKD